MKRLEIITFFFFISCAVFAQNTWTSIGPWYASDPRDIAVASNGTMYTIGGTNREIMKSVNQGNSWTHLATPQTDVYCIGVKPDNDQVIIIGTGSSTVVRSVDGGSTWTTITTTSIANRPNKIKFSPVNKSVVFVGTLEATSGEHLFRSKDSGATFTAMTNFVRTTVTDIAFDPTNADTVYISGTKTGTSGLITQGFWRSVNSVSATQPSWSIKISGMTNKNIGAIAIDPSTRANVFCISYSGTWSIYNSTNYGGSWSATTPANAVPAGRDLIAHSSSTFIAATLSGLWETTNSGTSWSAMSVSHMPDTVTQSLAKYTSGGTTYYFCGTTSYVNRSTDVGATWTTVDDGLLLLPLTSVAVKDSINMFALGTASYSGLIWKATDLSGIWTSELDHYIPSTNIAIEGKDIAANNTYVVVSAQKTSSGGPVVLVSADSGGTWFTSYNPGGAGTANQIAFNPD